jgi:hypothetical protein
MIKVIIMEEKKSIFKSKTFWVGALTVVIGLLQAIQGEIVNGASISTLGLVNIALRLVTETKAVLK